MQMASGLGAVILPLVLTIYNHPSTIEDMTRHMVGKILGILDLGTPRFQRWGSAEQHAERCG